MVVQIKIFFQSKIYGSGQGQICTIQSDFRFNSQRSKMQQTSLPSPPGFQEPPIPSLVYQSKASEPAPSATAVTEATDPHAKLKQKKAWEVAWSPAKQIPMNAFMLWMSGGGVQIFSIMITAMLFYQPLKAIAALPQAFQAFESKNSSSTLLPKIVYCLMQLAVMALGLWKCQQMGLLPTASSDWLAFLSPKIPRELAL